jgi:hypothetical protein
VRRRIAASAVAAGAFAIAVVLLATTLAVSAFTDAATLNLGVSGIGSSSRFQLITVGPDGRVHAGAVGSPVGIPVIGDDSFVPGRTVTLDLGVGNNSPGFAAAVTIAVRPSDDGGTGQVGTSPNITPFIRVTVVDTTTGTLLVGGSATDPAQGVTVDAASAAIGRLAARGAPPLADGDQWTAGSPGSRHDLAVSLYYPDTPETSAYNGGRTALEVLFDGASTP